jgi:hypothetical protein
MPALFDVTYEIVTPESAENGDAEERGFITENVTLREAVNCVTDTRTNQVDGVERVETDEYPVCAPRWITVINGTEYRTGAQESRSLHMPDSLTPATRIRIARLLGVRC